MVDKFVMEVMASVGLVLANIFLGSLHMSVEFHEAWMILRH